MEKKSYVISALRNDSKSLGDLKKHPTEKVAVEAAKEIIERRRRECQPEMGFYILEVKTYVGPAKSPIKVVKLK